MKLHVVLANCTVSVLALLGGATEHSDGPYGWVVFSFRR